MKNIWVQIGAVSVLVIIVVIALVYGNSDLAEQALDSLFGLLENN